MNPYFKDLVALLKIEQQEDRRQYQQLLANTSVAERRANGLAWYPVAIRGTDIERGDYLSVELERTTHQELPHQLRFGMPAVLFGNHQPDVHRLEATIVRLVENRVKLLLKTDELPDWTRDGKLGVEVLFDENAYTEMFEALQQASQASDNPLIDILTGKRAVDVPAITQHYPLPASLNTVQQQAVRHIVSSSHLSIVHGPPGTGKTTTLVAAIGLLCQQQTQPLLVVAPSNTAVDLLSEKLSQQGLQVLRAGNPARVSEHLMRLTLESQLQNHLQAKDIKKLKKQAQEYKNMAQKYKRNFGPSEREQRKLLLQEARNIGKEIEKIEQYITNDILSKTQVVTATLVGCNQYNIRHLQYKTVVIDEAGQALEPACWIPLLKAAKVILAGDHCQLPPTIKSPEAARAGLQETLLEKCVQKHPEAVIRLEEQYRMNQAIMGYSSQVFYENSLKAAPSVATQQLWEGDCPVEFIDTAGCGFEEKQVNTSTYNPEEASLLLKHLQALLSNTAIEDPSQLSIAIISPYKQQVICLKEQLAHADIPANFRSKLAVNTIDSFQGQERSIVYISLVRSNTQAEIGFLNDIRRMNVAMTRAQKKLVVVGDSATLAQWPFYENFIQYAEQQGGYQSAWTWM